MAKKNSKLGFWFVVFVLIAGGIFAWWWYRKPADAAIEYRSVAVTRGDVVQSVTANGQLNPGITVQVGSQVSGNITNLYADFNSRVTNGQLIAELDPATYQARAIQAEGELANAKALMNLGRVNAQRAEELMKNNLIARADYDQTMAELQQREATVRMREASLNSAQVDLARTKIYSPIDGMVISRNVDIGQTVQASFTAPTLFNIANDLTRMEIAAMVSEADIGGVEEGQEASFTVEAFQNRTFGGRVSQVRNQPTTNQNVVTYATIIAVGNPDLKLKPGMTANVAINTAKKEKVIRVSNAALRFRPPEGAVVKTNILLLASAGTNAPDSNDGLPEFPGGFQPSPEMRQRLIQRYDTNGDGRLDESERQAMVQARQARMSGGGGGMGEGRGPGLGGGSERSRSISSPPAVRTAYLISTNTTATGRKVVELQPVQVKTGINDGVNTEIVEGLKEGDIVATIALSTQASASATTPSNPFGGPFGGQRRMMR